MHPITPEREQGFTLIEAIVVIAITGIVMAMVAVFIVPQIQAYLLQQQTSQLTNLATHSLARLARELSFALPNSVRVTQSGADTYIEFLPMIDAGRYRLLNTSTGTGDILDFTQADTSFDVMGFAVNVPATPTWVAVYNLGIPGDNAYNGDNVSLVAGSGSLSNLTIAAKQFPFPSPNLRFQLIGTPVTFHCAPASTGATLGYLERIDGYASTPYSFPTQPTSFAASARITRMNDQLSSCTVEYAQNLLGRNGILGIRLTLGNTAVGNTANINLYQEIHIDNSP